jgi:hypothetical protein
VTTDGVVVELAATSPAGMYQYTFPPRNDANNILIDISHVLPSFRGQGLGQGMKGARSRSSQMAIMRPLESTTMDGTDRQIGLSTPICVAYSSFIVALTNTQADISMPPQQQPALIPKLLVKGAFCNQADQPVRIRSTDIMLRTMHLRQQYGSRVGISWISNEKACQNLQDEIPAGTRFSTVVQGTKGHLEFASTLYHHDNFHEYNKFRITLHFSVFHESFIN